MEELEAGYAAGADGAPATAAIPNSIKKALDYIDKHLTSPFSIKEIAYSLKWSHEHFTRLFAKHLGLSPQQVVLQRRIEKACQLLLHESWSVKQVAHSVGFGNEHYFSRAFAKAKGMTATRYREKFADPRLQHLSPIDEYQAPYPLNRYLFFRSAD